MSFPPAASALMHATAAPRFSSCSFYPFMGRGGPLAGWWQAGGGWKVNILVKGEAGLRLCGSVSILQ